MKPSKLELPWETMVKNPLYQRLRNDDGREDKEKGRFVRPGDVAI